MAETHKAKKHISHKHRHHDPVKKQEILDKVDALLKEETEAENPPVNAPAETVSAASISQQQSPGGKPTLSESPPPISTVMDNTSEAISQGVQSSVSPQQQNVQPTAQAVSSQPPVETGQQTPVSSPSPLQTLDQGQQVEGSQPVQAGAAQGAQEAVPPWRNDIPQEEVVNNESSSKKKILTVIIFLIVLLVSVGGGYFIYAKVLREEPSKNKENTSNSQTSAKTGKETMPTSAPTPTEKPVDLTSYSIKVLNGSGIKGAASSAKALLEEEGFEIDSVGNADAQDYVKTVIQAGSSIDDAYLDKLKEVLGKNYVLSGVKEIDEGETVDVIVVLGSTRAEE